MNKETIIDEVIDAFVDAGFVKEADRLTSFKLKLLSDDPQEKAKACKDITGFCQLKVWGDLAVHNKGQIYGTLNEWNAALTQLSSFSKKA